MTVSRRAIILGSGSDIGRGLAERLSRAGWDVVGVPHNSRAARVGPWDLVVCCYGSLEPIAGCFDAYGGVAGLGWRKSFDANLFRPLRDVRWLYPHRREGASVCFFSGAGSGGPAPTFSAYAAAKVALIKMTELLDNESPDCKFFVLGPGIVRTKILNQIVRAGRRAANHERVQEFLASGDPGTSHDDIYACLMACVAASKAAVGGRNIYVPADDWRRLEELAGKPNMFKLRREGDNALRRYEIPEPARGIHRATGGGAAGGRRD